MKQTIFRGIKIVLLVWFSFNLFRGLILGLFITFPQLVIALLSFLIVLFDILSKYYIKSLPKIFYIFKPWVGIAFSALGLSLLLSVFKGELNFLLPENPSNLTVILFLLLPVLIIIYGVTFASSPFELKGKLSKEN